LGTELHIIYSDWHVQLPVATSGLQINEGSFDT